MTTPALCSPLASTIAPISKGYYNPPVTRTGGNLLPRAFELESATTPVSPYHREVVTATFTKVLGEQAWAEQIEQGLFETYPSPVKDYGWKAATLIILLGKVTEIGQFANQLRKELQAHLIPFAELATYEVTELFPELYQNEALTEDEREYLGGQLHEEIESAWLLLARELARAREVRTLDLTQLYNYITEQTFLCPNQGRDQCFELYPVLKSLARDGANLTTNGHRFSPFVEAALRRKYRLQIALLQYH